VIHSTVNGLLSKDQRVQLSDEEREKRAAEENEKDELRQLAYNWLVSHEGPVFDGTRQNGRAITEIMAAMNFPTKRHRLLQTVLESETTGWGKVGVLNDLPMYGKKALLIGFVPRQPAPPVEASQPSDRQQIRRDWQA